MGKLLLLLVPQLSRLSQGLPQGLSQGLCRWEDARRTRLLHPDDACDHAAPHSQLLRVL